MRRILILIAAPFVWYYRSITHRQKPGCCSVCDDPLGPGDPDYCIDCREFHEW